MIRLKASDGEVRLQKALYTDNVLVTFAAYHPRYSPLLLPQEYALSLTEHEAAKIRASKLMERAIDG